MLESRNDIYPDPQDVMTYPDEVSDEAKKASQVDSFFEEFNFMSSEQQLEIAEAVLDEVRSTMLALVQMNIGVTEKNAQSPYLYKKINEAARKHAKHLVDTNQVTWS